MSRRRIALAAMLALVSVGAARHSTARMRGATPIDGVWEYINPGMKGQAFIMDGRYAFFSRQDGATASDSLTTFSVTSGRYTIADTLVTSTNEYASNTRDVGQTWRWSYSMQGDTCTYHVLDATGKAVYTGRAVRRRAGR